MWGMRLGTGMLVGLLGWMASAEPPAIDAMEQLHFRQPKEKGTAALVPGHQGQGVEFSFGAESRSVFFIQALQPTPEWDRAEGFSFWVKGDGSDSFGGIQFIYDEDYEIRYDYAFSVRSREWTKVTVAWRDLVPVLPKGKPLDPGGEFRPSKLSALWVGKWWYWRDYPAHSFALDELRLETRVPQDRTSYRPVGDPLSRVKARLQAGKPISVVTMGDSLTDYRHNANRETAWPRLLQEEVTKQFGSAAAIENPAIGGTQLRQGLVLIPRWASRVPEPDLVTVCYGFNDWEAGMRGERFYGTAADAVDRIRRATRGKADVLLCTTLPALPKWRTMAELAEAVRKAARDRNAGLADTEKAFLAAGAVEPERLYHADRVHLGRGGHALMAKTVLATLK